MQTSPSKLEGTRDFRFILFWWPQKKKNLPHKGLQRSEMSHVKLGEKWDFGPILFWWPQKQRSFGISRTQGNRNVRREMWDVRVVSMSHKTHIIRCLMQISRLLKITGLFFKRALYKRRVSAKETYNFKEPTNRSHPICKRAPVCSISRSRMQKKPSKIGLFF